MDRPKQAPINGYMIFNNSAQHDLANIKSVVERAAKIKPLWDALTQEEKNVFDNQAKQQQAAYKIFISQYYSKHPEEQKKDEEISKMKLQKAFLKRQLPGFMVFALLHLKTLQERDPSMTGKRFHDTLSKEYRKKTGDTYQFDHEQYVNKEKEFKGQTLITVQAMFLEEFYDV